MGDRRTLEAGVVRFGDERPVGEIVDVWSFPDERDVYVHEHIRKGTVNVMLSARTRTQDPAAVALVEDALIHADPGALRNAIVSISLLRPDLTQRLAEISVPTLFVSGSDHKGWTPHQAVAASKVLPQGSAAVVTDASYLVPFENPAATIQLVRQFWVDHSSSITPP
ncbi:MAG: alpha/beta hydrolase [Candidatus Limnocylindrales bacterium]